MERPRAGRREREAQLDVPEHVAGPAERAARVAAQLVRRRGDRAGQERERIGLADARRARTARGPDGARRATPPAARSATHGVARERDPRRTARATPGRARRGSRCRARARRAAAASVGGPPLLGRDRPHEPARVGVARLRAEASERKPSRTGAARGRGVPAASGSMRLVAGAAPPDAQGEGAREPRQGERRAPRRRTSQTRCSRSGGPGDVVERRGATRGRAAATTSRPGTPSAYPGSLPSALHQPWSVQAWREEHVRAARERAERRPRVVRDDERAARSVGRTVAPRASRGATGPDRARAASAAVGARRDAGRAAAGSGSSQVASSNGIVARSYPARE